MRFVSLILMLIDGKLTIEMGKNKRGKRLKINPTNQDGTNGRTV
jgi:hypothetical protein